MQSFFNYNTLNVSLERSTRTIFVKLNRSESAHNLNMETLFELESLFAWLSNKVEIHSVFISSEDSKDGVNNIFSCGYSLEKLNEYDQSQILKLTEKLSHLVHSMQNLPQSFICDLREGASNIACELAVGADIRIADETCELEFNHNKLGLTPSSSGMATLALMVGQFHAKNFLLTGKKISAETAKLSGYLFETYSASNRTHAISNLLTSINEQAPVQRIQTKLGIFDLERINYEQSIKIEKQIAKASMMTEDWKKVKVHIEQDNEIRDDFLPAKSMSYAAKLTLVDTDNSPEISN